MQNSRLITGAIVFAGMRNATQVSETLRFVRPLKSGSRVARAWCSWRMSRTSQQQPQTQGDPNVARVAGLFQAAFQNSPAMRSIVRFPDAVLVQVNETFTKTLGYTREVLGKTPFELNFWVAPEKLRLYREQLETEGFVRNYEIEVRAKDGSIRTVIGPGNIDGVRHSVSAAVDITAREPGPITVAQVFGGSPVTYSEVGGVDLREVLLTPASQFLWTRFEAVSAHHIDYLGSLSSRNVQQPRSRTLLFADTAAFSLGGTE